MVGLYFLPITSDPNLLYYLAIGLFLIMMSINLATFYTVLLPSIANVVGKKLIGTAWGICGSSIGISQCFMSIVMINVLSR
jgi:hypothetical protein